MEMQLYNNLVEGIILKPYCISIHLLENELL